MGNLLRDLISIPSIPDSTKLKNLLPPKNTHLKSTSQSSPKITQKQIKDLFKADYGYSKQTSVFNRVWKVLKADEPLHSLKPLTIGKLRKVDKMFKENIIYKGPGIKPPKNSLEHTDMAIHAIIKTLLHGEKLSPKAAKLNLLKAIFLKKDVKLLNKFRAELQHEMNNLALNPPKTEKEAFLWRAFLGNIIALLPFTYPTNSDTVSIPTLQSDSTCKMIEYNIEVLNLKNSKYSSDMTALAMTPKISHEGHDILSFIGTTFPAGQGFFSGLSADFTPGKSVGESVYDKNNDKFDTWLKGKTNVEAYGMSLGGAMALHLYRHHPNKFVRMDLYSPPGLYQNCWDKKITSSCDVNIYTQPGDIVTQLGQWPTTKNIKLYSVITDKKKDKRNPLAAHAKVNTGCDEITIVKLDPKKENSSFGRRLVTWAHKYMGPVLVWAPIKSYIFFKHHLLRLRNKN